MPRDGIVTVALSWILLFFFGGLPFVLTGEISNLADAFFETDSGFTTTGSSILSDLSILGYSSLFWCSFTHLVGGRGVLVFILMLVKVPLFDTLLLSFGKAGTGGFAINNAGFAIYQNPEMVEWIIGIGMMFFGVNFNLYYFLLLGSIREVLTDEEDRSYIGIIAFASLSIVQSRLDVSFRSVFFTVLSIITTTGYSTADFGLWGVFPQVVLLLLMFIGGCAGSTTGGIKVSRVVIYVKNSISEIKKMIQPRRVIMPKFNGKVVDDKMSSGIANYLLVYVAVFLVLLISASFEAPDFLTAFSSVAATFNNIGPGLGEVGPTSNFSMYSDFNMILLSRGMIAGRLEIYPMILLFSATSIGAFFISEK